MQYWLKAHTPEQTTARNDGYRGFTPPTSDELLSFYRNGQELKAILAEDYPELGWPRNKAERGSFQMAVMLSLRKRDIPIKR